jgi:hypothetical protein
MLRHAHGTLPGGPGGPKGTSSTGRASVSKTEGWGFKSLVPCNTGKNVQSTMAGRKIEER